MIANRFRFVVAFLVFSGAHVLHLAAQENRPVTWADVGGWKSITSGSTTLSPDGSWFAYWYGPNIGNADLVLQHVQTDDRHVFSIGETPRGGGGGSIAFSDDGRFIAFRVFAEHRPDGKKNDEDSPFPKLKVVDLATQTEVAGFEKVRRFHFAEERSGWIAVQRSSPDRDQGGDQPRGTDLILHHLDDESSLNIGNVAEYAFSDDGRWLAWIVDAHEKAGNGIQVRDMETGAVRALESAKARYRSLRWTDDGQGLIALRSEEDEAYENDLNSVVAFSGFDDAKPLRTVFDPREQAGFPDDKTVSPHRFPFWSDDMSMLMFGIHKLERKEKAAASDTTETIDSKSVANNDKQADVVIWHWQDPRLQSQQRLTRQQDRNFNHLVAYQVADQRFVRLTDDDVTEARLSDNHRYAVGFDQKRYELDASLSGERFADVYVIDVATGSRKVIAEKLQMVGMFPNISPDGRFVALYDDGEYLLYDIETGARKSLTADVPSSFIRDDIDRNVPNPPTPFWGWSSDARFVLIRDNRDVWRISTETGEAANLTSNSTSDRLRYEFRFVLDREEKGIDLDEPMFVRVFDEATKQSGIARVDGRRGGAVILHFGAAQFRSLTKAENADVYIYTRETPVEPPEYFASRSSDLGSERRLTRNDEQQAEYAWSAGSRLVHYVTARGDSLQGALLLPAYFEEGRQYPTIVYIYERLSQTLNTYRAPSFPRSGFNASIYTSNGYAVFMPDITYQLNDPGMSAVWAVLPALDAAVESGVVDPERVGLHGHSWGGYQTAFLITQTDRFKAAVAGAPLTNMISMYSLIYWNTGGWNGAIFESSQGRLTAGYWENWDAFKRNSPVYYAANVSTPLLMMHNDKDGAVDFTQGIEYYNTLRRMQKPVIMLQYPGENHGLAQRPNQIDYAMRMKEFFNHYLIDADAPEWIEKGIPHLEMERHLESRPAVLK